MHFHGGAYDLLSQRFVDQLSLCADSYALVRINHKSLFFLRASASPR